MPASTSYDVPANYTILVKFENATMTGDFALVFEENSVKEIT